MFRFAFLINKIVVNFGILAVSAVYFAAALAFKAFPLIFLAFFQLSFNVLTIADLIFAWSLPGK